MSSCRKNQYDREHPPNRESLPKLAANRVDRILHRTQASVQEACLSSEFPARSLFVSQGGTESPDESTGHPGSIYFLRETLASALPMLKIRGVGATACSQAVPDMAAPALLASKQWHPTRIGRRSSLLCYRGFVVPGSASRVS